MKETGEIGNVAVEEEVLMGVERMARNCNSALRDPKGLRDLLRVNGLNGHERN